MSALDSIDGLDQLRRVELNPDAAAFLAGAAASLSGLQGLGERATLRPRGANQGADLVVSRPSGLLHWDRAEHLERVINALYNAGDGR